MRKIKEVLRLRFGLGLQQDQIARSCSIGQATVHRYLERAAAAGLELAAAGRLRRPAAERTSVSDAAGAAAVAATAGRGFRRSPCASFKLTSI